MFDKPLLSHPEVQELSGDGVMHEGIVSTVLALPGIPAEAETVMTGRDISLAESTGGRIHMMHISTARQYRSHSSGKGKRSPHHS